MVAVADYYSDPNMDQHMDLVWRQILAAVAAVEAVEVEAAVVVEAVVEAVVVAVVEAVAVIPHHFLAQESQMSYTM